jgi:hypothetical protein
MQAQIPNFAPLSEDMVLLLLREAEIPTLRANEQARLRFLEQQVQELRLEVYHRLTAHLGVLTSQWLCEELDVTPTTLTRWKRQGLLCYQEKNRADPQNVAALLLMHRLLKKQRRWLPQTCRTLGPCQWQCWRQDAPGAPVLPCPFPLPPSLPKHTFLWTDWLGASWEPHWIPLDDIGAARWAQTIHDTPLWDVDEKDLAQWSRAYTPPSTRLAPRLRQHYLASSLLLDLAEERLLLSPKDTEPLPNTTTLLRAHEVEPQ